MNVDNPFSFTNTPPRPGGIWMNLVYLLNSGSRKLGGVSVIHFQMIFQHFPLKHWNFPAKHSPKVYFRICLSIRLFLVNRPGLVVSMGFIMSYQHFMCCFSCVRCSTWILDGKQGCNNRSGNDPRFDARISVFHGLNP